MPPSRLGRVMLLAEYEWRRAIARRKVLLLTGASFAFQAAPFAIFATLQIPTLQVLIRPVQDIGWIIGVLLPQGLFLHLLALLIATSATAEEYEQGTADILLTKPLSRKEYLVGKYLGGYSLTALVSLLLTIFGIVLAYATFGPQRALEQVPAVWLSIAYTILVFFSLGFLLGEVHRRSGHALLTGVSLLISSFVVTGVLFFAYQVTRDTFYLTVNKALPTWGAGNLPQMVVNELVTRGRNIPFLQGGPPVPGSLLEAVLAIAAYAIVPAVLASIRFLRTDIPRRTV